MASSSDAQPPREQCPGCSMAFTARSLREHINNSHLGVKCYFPGSQFNLNHEDDAAMTTELLRANAARVQVSSNEADPNGNYWCYWPGCKENKPHSYKTFENLKRHLRTKQRQMYKDDSQNMAANLGGLVPNTNPFQLTRPERFEVWFNIRTAVAVWNAKFEFLNLAVVQSNPHEDIGPIRLGLFIQETTKALITLDGECQRLLSIIGYGQNNSLEDNWTGYRLLKNQIEIELGSWAATGICQANNIYSNICDHKLQLQYVLDNLICAAEEYARAR